MGLEISPCSEWGLGGWLVQFWRQETLAARAQRGKQRRRPKGFPAEMFALKTEILGSKTILGNIQEWLVRTLSSLSLSGEDEAHRTPEGPPFAGKDEALRKVPSCVHQCLNPAMNSPRMLLRGASRWGVWRKEVTADWPVVGFIPILVFCISGSFAGKIMESHLFEAFFIREAFSSNSLCQMQIELVTARRFWSNCS